MLLAAPFVILLIMFNYVPLFGWMFSFFDYKPGIPLSRTPFVGLKYFLMIMNERNDILRVLKNTFAMGFLGILATPLPAIMAIMLNEVRISKFKKLVQVTTTIPNFISWVITYSFAFAIFSSEGMLNTLLNNIGISDTAANLLSNGSAVWQFQTLLGIWKTLGWSSIIYLAAITGIDGELYSAAKVDGAGRFRSMLHVTVPGLAPTFIVLLLLSISNILTIGFDQYFVFKNPAVMDKIEVIDLYVYRIGIVENSYSFSIAVGILKSVFSIALLLSANGIAKRLRGQPIF